MFEIPESIGLNVIILVLFGMFITYKILSTIAVSSKKSSDQCRHCDAILSIRDKAKGWCDCCGKRLP